MTPVLAEMVYSRLRVFAINGVECIRLAEADDMVMARQTTKGTKIQSSARRKVWRTRKSYQVGAAFLA